MCRIAEGRKTKERSVIFVPLAGQIEVTMQLGLIQILEANKEVCFYCGPSDVEKDQSDLKQKNTPSKLNTDMAYLACTVNPQKLTSIIGEFDYSLEKFHPRLERVKLLGPNSEVKTFQKLLFPIIVPWI